MQFTKESNILYRFYGDDFDLVVEFNYDEIYIRSDFYTDEFSDFETVYFFGDVPVAEFEIHDETIQELTINKVVDSMNLNHTEDFELELVKKLINTIAVS